MSYVARLTPDAEADLARLPPMVAPHVLDQLDHLAADPVRLSQPPSFPHPLYQKYQFPWPPHAPLESMLTILFVYSQDETTIEVVGIGIVRYR